MTDIKPAVNVVPFGKYKGQPVQALAQDRPYLEWLSAQPWFRERYAGIYTLIVNNFTEAAETPDHNALQVLFLDDAFCERFATALHPQRSAGALKTLENTARQNIEVVATRLDELKARHDRYADNSVDWQISDHKKTAAASSI